MSSSYSHPAPAVACGAGVGGGTPSPGICQPPAKPHLADGRMPAPTGIYLPSGHPGTTPPPLFPTSSTCTSSLSSASAGHAPPTGIAAQAAAGLPDSAAPHPAGASLPPLPLSAHDEDAQPAAAACTTAPPLPESGQGAAPADDLAGEEERAAVARAERWAWQLRQRRVAPNPHYMSRQLEVDASMRRILVEWLIELYEELRLSAEVLLSAVHHVDRFLSSEVVPKESLQLVGAVALMIAHNSFCKLPKQDGEPPVDERGMTNADDVVYWTDST